MPVRKSDPAFYVGRESFKMKVVGGPPAHAPAKPTPTTTTTATTTSTTGPVTPPARTPLPMTTPTPPRPLSYPPPVTTPYPRRVTAELPPGGITMAKTTFAGFCLTAFAFGIVTTVVIDRIWPRTYEEPAATRLEPLPVPVPPEPKPLIPEVRELKTSTPEP